MKSQPSKAERNRLKDDLCKFHEHWEKALKDKGLAKDKHFLQELANDIKNLENDAVLMKANESKMTNLIHHLLTTPWGAPFVFKHSLLQAALNQGENIQNSELGEIIDDFIKYSDSSNNPLLETIETLEDLINID
jgi:hypothetical protein